MRKQMYGVALGALLATTGLAPLAGATPLVAHADTIAASGNVSTITVVGHSTQTVSPDIAVIDAGVTTNGKDAVAAQKANDAAMNKIMAALKTTGIVANDISTSWYNIHPNYGTQGKSGQPTLEGFQANDNISVHVANLTEVGQILDLLVTSGANQINDVQYEVSNPLRYEESAYQSAIADARAQADTLAKSLGMAVTGVQSVDTTNAGTVPIFRYGAASAQAASTPISPGTQSIDTSVQVVFTIAQPTATQ